MRGGGEGEPRGSGSGRAGREGRMPQIQATARLALGNPNTSLRGVRTGRLGLDDGSRMSSLKCKRTTEVCEEVSSFMGPAPG